MSSLGHNIFIFIFIFFIFNYYYYYFFFDEATRAASKIELLDRRLAWAASLGALGT